MCVTLTTDSGKILAKLHAMQPKGELQLLSGIKIAHLALKHRLGKNHKTRIVVFVGSPIEAEEKELIKIAKKLKKEKVSVDVVSFGEDDCNKDLLGKFIETVNGRDGKDSHMLSIPTGPHLSDALVSSAIVQVLTSIDFIYIPMYAWDFRNFWYKVQNIGVLTANGRPCVVIIIYYIPT